MKVSKGIDATLILAGFAYGLDNIQNILGIIILVIQLLWFTIKLALLVAKAIRSGNLEDGDKALDEFIEDAKEAIKGDK